MSGFRDKLDQIANNAADKKFASLVDNLNTRSKMGANNMGTVTAVGNVVNPDGTNSTYATVTLLDGTSVQTLISQRWLLVGDIITLAGLRSF